MHERPEQSKAAAKTSGNLGRETQDSFDALVKMESAIDIKQKVTSVINEQSEASIAFLGSPEELDASINDSVDMVIAHQDFQDMKLSQAKKDITARMRKAYRAALEKKMINSGNDEEAINLCDRLLARLDSAN